MDDHTLLSAIHAALDDDAPRLVYADLLQQRGDPRGEWIALQCRLAHVRDDDPSWPALVRRERSLWRAHGADWRWPGLLEIERGFPSFAVVQHTELPAIRERVPTLRRAHIYPPTRFDHLVDVGGIRALALEVPRGPVWPPTPALHRVADLWLHVRDLDELIDLPAFESLERLELFALRWHRCTLRNAPAILRGNLRRLSLVHLAFPALETFGNLEHVSLTSIPTESAAAIVDRTRADTLTHLALRGIPLAPDHPVLTSPALRGVRRLSLAGARIGEAGLVRLLPRLDRVDDLDLSNCALDAAAVRTLVRSPVAARLRRLDLSRNPIGDAGAALLASALPALTRLHLDKAGIGEVGIRALARGDVIRRLVVLAINRNAIGAGIADLAGAFGPRLVGVDLRWTGTDAAGIAALNDAPAEFEPVELSLTQPAGVRGRVLEHRYQMRAMRAARAIRCRTPAVVFERIAE